MRTRACLLLVVTTVVALVLPGWVGTASATTPAPPAGGTVQGTVRDVDGPVRAGAVLAQLYRWDATLGSFVAVKDEIRETFDATDDQGRYSFPDLEPGSYTVRFADASGDYVTETWPTATGLKPVAETDRPGVVVVPEPDETPAPGTDPPPSTPEVPPLDGYVLRVLSNSDGEPLVTGVRRVGSTLTTTPGEWSVEESTMTFAYQWQRVDSAGVARDIPGATRPSYLLTAAEVGNGIRVRVTGSRPGYVAENGYSGETEVGKALSATSTRLAYSRIRSFRHGRVRVTVAPALLRPTGRVTVRIDGRPRVGTTLRSTQAGSVALSLPLLRKGRHRVLATYGGSSVVSGSTSRVIWLTVVR